MKLEKLCKKRRIPKVSIGNSNTPKLIPSYSSVCSLFFNPMDLQDLYNYTIEQAPFSSLISAFDIHYKNLDRKKIWSSEIVFIDSGNYEASHPKLNPNGWSLELYLKTIKGLRPTTDLCIISYDKYDDLEEQINIATRCFELCPNYTHDFLIKPEKEKIVNWDFKKIEYYKEIINSFDILGITEKELGKTIDERCRNLIKFRGLINDEKPIHIFGCIDFISVIIYFLCGADIFDGTSWMRYFYWKGYAVYLNQYDLITESWPQKCNINKIQAIKDNLIERFKFEAKLVQFINTRDFNTLELDHIINNRIIKLLNQLGVEI